MKPFHLIMIIVGCALVATWVTIGRKPNNPPVSSMAKQGITSSQQFENFYGLDTFTFKKEAYFVLINEKETALYKLDISRFELVPANLFPASQKLVQYKIDSQGRLTLVLEENGELIAELLEGSKRTEIKLGKLLHRNLGHSLCCADILSEGEGLFVWHERQLLKFDLTKNPPKKVFDQQMNFDTSDKGNLYVQNDRVYLDLRDGQDHFFAPNSLIFHSEQSDRIPRITQPSDGSAGISWDPNWPEPYVHVEKVFDLGRPVILSAEDEVFYLDEFNHWSKITSHVDMFALSTSYALRDGNILFVGQRKDGKGNKNLRHLTIFDTIHNTYSILTLELG